MQYNLCFEYIRAQFTLRNPQTVTCYKRKMTVRITQFGKIR